MPSVPYTAEFDSGIDTGLTEVDTAGLISVADGRAIFANGGLANWTDHRLVSTTSFTRSEVGAVIAVVRKSNAVSTNGGFKLAVSPSSSDPDASGSVSISTSQQGSGNMQLLTTGRVMNAQTTRAIDYAWIIVARTGGGFFIIVSGGEYGTWPTGTVVGVTDTEVDAAIYVHLAAKQASASVHWLKVVAPASLPASLTTRFGVALAGDSFNRGSLGTTTEVGGKTYSLSGAIVISSNQMSVPTGAYFTFDPGARGRIIELTVTSANRNFAVYFRNNGTTINAGPVGTGYSLFFDSGATGVYNEAGSAVVSQTGAADRLWAAGTHKIRIHDLGANCRVYYDDVDIGGAIAIGSYGSQFGVGFTNYSGGTITIEEIAVYNTVDLGGGMGSFPTIPGGVGSTFATQAFGAADGSALPTGWVAGTAQAWEQRSGTLRMTTASVNGWATVDLGSSKQEVQSKIFHPNTTPLYPIDWYAGLVLVYSDSTHYVYVRTLRQDGSNEIEVLYANGGAQTIFAYTNLGNVYVPGGSNVFRAAILGREVAAWLDDVLVVQGTVPATLTGTRAGYMVNDNNPNGQPLFDDFQARLTQIAQTGRTKLREYQLLTV